MTTIKQISTSLNAKRELSNLTVTELAEHAGVARAAIYRFNNGSDIRLSTFLSMADTLGLDIVLAPKAVSVSLQAAVTASPSANATLTSQTQSGPRSAVDARLDKIRAQLRGGTT
jgi:predicted transcriptional regulator